MPNNCLNIQKCKKTNYLGSQDHQKEETLIKYRGSIFEYNQGQGRIMVVEPI
jgi:hypothetical protein